MNFMIAQSIKQLLKPDWKKIILVAVLFILSTGISGKLNNEVDNDALYGPIGFMVINGDLYKEYGFPLKWLKIEGREKMTSYNLSLVSDIIFWYFISCLLILVRDKIKSNKMKA